MRTLLHGTSRHTAGQGPGLGGLAGGGDGLVLNRVGGQEEAEAGAWGCGVGKSGGDAVAAAGLAQGRGQRLLPCGGVLSGLWVLRRVGQEQASQAAPGAAGGGRPGRASLPPDSTPAAFLLPLMDENLHSHATGRRRRRR